MRLMTWDMHGLVQGACAGALETTRGGLQKVEIGQHRVVLQELGGVRA